MVEGGVAFWSTQFGPIDEQEAFRAILQEGGFDFIPVGDASVQDLVLAGMETGEGQVDLLGRCTGTFRRWRAKMR
jgi:multiple sugar transport system substrate-binding protein